MLAGTAQQRAKKAETAALKEHMDNLPPPPKV
jgi:hypothetical protein